MNSENLHKKIHKYILIIIGIILISFITYSTGASVLPDIDQQKDKIDKNLVYAITTPHHLAVIDTTTDKIIKTIDIGSSNHLNPIIDHNGNVYLSHYKELLEAPGEDIIIYKPAGNKVIRLSSHGNGPTSVIPMNINQSTKLFVANYRSKEVKGATSSIAIFDKNYFFKKNITMDNNETISYSMINNITNDKLYALATYLGVNENMYKSYLYIIDPNEEKIINKIFLSGGGNMNRIIETTDNKIYTTPAFAKTGNKNDDIMGDYLCVYDNKVFNLIKTIKLTVPLPVALIYYPNLNKLYVQGYVDGIKDFQIDIIDTKTDKLIKTLTIEGSDGIYRVSKDKLYINMIYVEDDKRGFQVLDVNKDEITGFIPGKFGGVSTIPIEWMMGK